VRPSRDSSATRALGMETGGRAASSAEREAKRREYFGILKIKRHTQRFVKLLLQAVDGHIEFAAVSHLTVYWTGFCWPFRLPP
jgi:hypothetical protein